LLSQYNNLLLPFTAVHHIQHNLTFCAIPNDSSIVTAIVRHCDSYWSLNLVAPSHKFLGKPGKVIRMT
jgi:hypothetical protein